MYDFTIVKRTQIYIDEEQDRRLGERSVIEGRTKSALIRTAIDEYLAKGESDESRHLRFVEVLHSCAGIAPYLPDGQTYVETIRTGDLRRQRELDHQWRHTDPEASSA